MNVLSIEDLEYHARAVRREVRDWYGFVEPQNTLFFLMDGEVSARLYERLLEEGIECLRVVVHIANGGPYHEVVWADHTIIDASVTQFNAAELRKYCLKPVPRGQYCYPDTGLPNLQEKPPIEMVPCKGLSDYPIGPVIEVGRHEDNPMGNIYTSRLSALIEEVTRFSPGGMHPGGMDAVEQALASEDIEWRRSVAAGLWSSKKKRAVRLCAKALEDIDPQVRRNTKESLRRFADGKLRNYLAEYAKGLKSDKRAIVEGILKRSEDS